jgi:hypothetical protein
VPTAHRGPTHRSRHPANERLVGRQTITSPAGARVDSSAVYRSFE